MMIRSLILLFLIQLGILMGAYSQDVHTLVVDAGKTLAPVSPTMWGIFFEDINFAADGGIYAEMVKNRSFEFRNPMIGWKAIELDGNKGEILTINREDHPANLRFVRLANANPSQSFGLSNEGFRGMGIRQGATYLFSLWACPQENDLSLRVELNDEKGNVLASSSLESFQSGWKEYSLTLRADATAEKGSLRLLFSGKGLIDIDMVSLFPADTWKNRPKGLRADLVELLDGLRPGFIRFPGGCIVEGYQLSERYQWKKTVGPIEERTTLRSRWMDEFRHRLTPDYYQSFGLGFYEYFLLSEDLGAEPLPILNCGMACQFNSKEVAALNEMEPYIQDALDLVEFANGDSTTIWGKLRADMGHPEPFRMKYLGIGNEQWGPQYIERYQIFHRVLKEKHPEIELISAAGPTTDERNAYLWEELRKLDADIIDEHYYKEPAWFLQNASRYDSFDRNGPKVFAGEYASHTRQQEAPEGRNNWEAALSEAAFMTGLERNADIVVMCSYAPLFAHKEAWQWNPNLIWFNNLKAMPTPNYMVQKLFSTHRGDHVVPVTEKGSPLTGQNQLYASTTIDDRTQTLYVKLVNTSEREKKVVLDVSGARLERNGVQEVLAGSPEQFNQVGGTQLFETNSRAFPVARGRAEVILPPRSVSLIKLKEKK